MEIIQRAAPNFYRARADCNFSRHATEAGSFTVLCVCVCVYFFIHFIIMIDRFLISRNAEFNHSCLMFYHRIQMVVPCLRCSSSFQIKRNIPSTTKSFHILSTWSRFTRKSSPTSTPTNRSSSTTSKFYSR